jgi:hypothetical protein
MGASPSINPALEGSEVATINPTFGPEIIGTTELNSLANSTESTAFVYANPSGKSTATVEILLNPISPTGSPKIQIISGSSGYEISLDTTANTARKVKFAGVSASFLSSFTVKNLSGVALASSGNYVVVTPVY